MKKYYTIRRVQSQQLADSAPKFRPQLQVYAVGLDTNGLIDFVECASDDAHTEASQEDWLMTYAAEHYPDAVRVFPHQLDRLPQDLCEWGCNTTDRIYFMLGHPAGKLPSDFNGTYRVDDFTIVVHPSISSTNNRRAKHRVFLMHEDGKGGAKLTPVGRVGQAARTKRATHRRKVSAAHCVALD